MCGIAGFSGLFDEDLLERMSALVAHRGPDDFGSLVLQGPDHRVGLAHRRLSIIDLSRSGHQPMGVNCERCKSIPSGSSHKELRLVYIGEIQINGSEFI